MRQRLAIFLDRPGFPWKRLIIGFSFGQFVLEGLLSLRQYKVLQKKKPPKTLEDEISQDVFDQSQVRATAHSHDVSLDTDLVHYRHMVEPKPNSDSGPGSILRYKTSSSSNTTSCRNCGR